MRLVRPFILCELCILHLLPHYKALKCPCFLPYSQHCIFYVVASESEENHHQRQKPYTLYCISFRIANITYILILQVDE